MDPTTLILEEYKISKDSLKSVMAQIVSVSASLIALPIVLLQFLFGKGTTASQEFLYYLILIILNFLATFIVYQNIQVTALERHISTLEKKLNMSDVFRWETNIAREWYSTNITSIILNLCFACPPLLILAALYYKLYQINKGSVSFYIVISINIVYLILILTCYALIVRRVTKVIDVASRSPNHEKNIKRSSRNGHG